LVLPASTSTPLVYGVVASQGAVGNTVDVFGTGFGAVQSVRFGGVATGFKALSTTEVQATVPGGSGTTSVQVEVGTVWSPTNCSTEFTYGPPLAPGTPQVAWVSPSLATAGTSVTVYGFNFQSSDSVYFGSVRAAGVALLSTNTLRAVVPASAGPPNVNVTVRIGSLVSPTSCADEFHYPGPQLTSITPARGWNPLTVVVKGANFSSSAAVYFGSVASPSVTYVSSSELKAVLPPGTGANSVPVNVRQGPYTSQSVTFTYTPPIPVVQAIEPDQGPAGSGVIVVGENLNSSAVVYFGARASTGTQWTSSTEVEARAPAGSGRVNVTVHQFGEVSGTVCSAEFTYGSALPSGSPYVAGLSSSEGIGGSWIVVTGVNFTPGTDEVFFGGVPSPAVNVSASTSTALDVEVPPGQGTVGVQVVSSVGSSPSGCGSEFAIVSPGPTPGPILSWNVTLPESTSAVPVFTASPGIQNGVIVVSAGARLALYEVGVSTVGSSGAGPALEGSLGSSVFSQIGQTELTLPGGTPLEVAAAPDGVGVFALVTTDQAGRTMLESLVWNGTGWGEPYFTAPTVGSASDPQVASAPFGQYDASWVDRGAGPARVDTAVFGSAGQLVRAPTEVAGSGGSTGNSVSTVSLWIDPMGHPVEAWSWESGPSAGFLGVWADYESPSSLMSGLVNSWNQLVPADFEDFGGSGLASFEARVQGALQSASSDIAQSDWCGADQNVSNAVYTNVTWLDRSPVVWAAAPAPGCSVAVGVGHNTIVAPNTGLLAANFYLSVQTEWLMESLGVGLMPIPAWNQFPTVNTTNPAWFQPDQASSGLDGSGQAMAVDPQTTGTNTLILVPLFEGQDRQQQTLRWGSGGCESSTVTDSPSEYINAAEIGTGGSTYGGTYTGASFVPIPAFTNLLPDRNGTYFDHITVQYSTVNLTVDNCASPPTKTKVSVPAPAGWPTTVTFDLRGHFTTGLDPYPGTLNLISEANTNPPGTATDSVVWNNTVSARAGLWINGTSGKTSTSAFWEDSNYRLQDTASGGMLAQAPGTISSLSMQLLSSNATVPSSWSPQIDVGGVSMPSPAQSFSAGCTDGGVGAVPIWPGPGSGISNLTSNSATLTWDSTVKSTGWVTLAESGGATTNVSAEAVVDPNGTAYEYVVEARGLAGWERYGLTYNVETVSACLSPNGGVLATLQTVTALKGPWLQVPGDPVMAEQDAPYDSVTHQGGGATLAWQVPVSFLKAKGTAFLNGSIELTTTNARLNATVIPLEAPLTDFTNYSIFGTPLDNGTASTFAVNVTGLDPNTEYTARIQLNYSTVIEPLVVGTTTINFWYEKDSSGDGLTNWEKSYGWAVTYENLSGWVREHVQANPYAFATNGLVGDFVEKEYGLNPTTVDTAGSHMLDTWNLTFNLKSGGGQLPSGSEFRVWYENSTYNPFATSVSFTPGGYETGKPIGNGNQTNLTPTASGGITSGDGSPWAARALWSYSALETLVNLSGVRHASWLRAVEGSWDGIPTLTVEGKLSWGANPLATSTPNDGIADGERVNPLYDVGLEFHSVEANQSGLGTGTGYAVYMNETYTSDSGTAVTLGNYSSEGIVGQSPSTVSNYTTTLPVTQTEPIQTVSLQVIARTTGGLTAIPIHGSGTTVVVRYPLAIGGSVVVSVQGSGTSGASTLFGVFQEVPMGTKAPTWLWVPTDNGTVNGLPLGLERYVGEQSFDLVVVNASSSISSMPIPTPWSSGNGTITLSPGLNDILVPREQFLDSPLGQAIFLGRNTSSKGTNGSLPLIGSSEQGVLSGFHGANWMVDLGAYWQNRSIGSGPGNLSRYETGVSGGSQLEVQVMAAVSATSGNTGGLGSDPGVYSTVGAPSALQSIVTMNLTNTTMFDLLLAGLIDNRSGGSEGVNGTLQSVTDQVGFLGLDRVVVNAIANGTEPSDGLYGPPSSRFPAAPPASAWGAFWNAATSLVRNPLGTVMSLADTVWNAATA
ncbi:MAG: IPT/TIG domain-containing protein, partial [Metallibacterium scheffleri]